MLGRGGDRERGSDCRYEGKTQGRAETEAGRVCSRGSWRGAEEGAGVKSEPGEGRQAWTGGQGRGRSRGLSKGQGHRQGGGQGWGNTASFYYLAPV